MLIKLTLDWNCVIEVEENQPQADSVKDLIVRHRQGEFEVALLAASASENTKSKRFPGSAEGFKRRVAALGWQDLPLVPMPAILDLSYFDFCYIVADGEKFEHDINSLWQVIASKVPRSPSDHITVGAELNGDTIQSEPLSKWRNTWCDVLSAYSHIHDGRDVFVTNNTRDFQANREKLFALGMRRIATPSEALGAVSELGS